MGDLTQALVDLGRAEVGRVRSRAALRDATTTVAGAILERLRTGDSVTVDETGPSGLKAVYRVAKVCWQVSQWANWEDGWGWSKSEATLLRNDAVLVDVREDEFDGSNLLHVVGSRIRVDGGHAFASHDDEDVDGPAGHLATDAERLEFAKEASAVIAAFAELLAGEDRAFAAAAQAIAKLTPR
jgi:hypothetical protein